MVSGSKSRRHAAHTWRYARSLTFLRENKIPKIPPAFAVAPRSDMCPKSGTLVPTAFEKKKES